MTNDLPLTGYDSPPTGSGESRPRILDPDGVRQLLDHERHHANRPQIVTMLEHRLASPVAGRVGFYTKRDSVTAFKAFTLSK